MLLVLLFIFIFLIGLVTLQIYNFISKSTRVGAIITITTSVKLAKDFLHLPIPKEKRTFASTT